MPAGYRPAADAYFLGAAPESTGSVQVVVNPAGEVTAFVANVHVAVALDGITFRCGPSGSAGCP
ncbi:MAG TPA: hypothetical protein VJL81_03695 [Solirubrobacterales bacterium]|nr:hypothetical protein [Solirubrobacterales bacterium]